MKAIAIFIILSLLIGFMGGYAYGAVSSLNWVAKQVSKFVDVDEELIKDALLNKRSQIENYG